MARNTHSANYLYVLGFKLYSMLYISYYKVFFRFFKFFLVLLHALNEIC